MFPFYYRCKTFEFFGKFETQKLKFEQEIKKENRRPVNGQHDLEQLSIGSERPDGTLELDGRKNKYFKFFWQKNYNPTEDETDAAATDHYNIQSRWENNLSRFVYF